MSLRKSLLLLLAAVCMSILFLGIQTETAHAGQNKSSVTVYLTVSEDGVYKTGNDENQTLMHRVPITVDYFNLGDYGLEDFYRYESVPAEEGGGYVERPATDDPKDDTGVVKQPTLLHLYIKALEEYYQGGGTLVPKTKGEIKNDDALYITGSATSMYMKRFWGHDENLMYFVDHKYPLQAEGWGATADYILLEDDMEIDVAMFSDWDFYKDGAFASFTPSNKTVAAGEEFTLQMRGTSTNGGFKDESGAATDDSIPMAGEDVVYARAEDTDGGFANDAWEAWDGTTDKNGNITMSFAKPGTYYISSSPTYQTFRSESNQDAACVAPPTAVITVEGSQEEVDDPSTENITVLQGMSFASNTAGTKIYPQKENFDPSSNNLTVYVPDYESNLAIAAEPGAEAKNASVDATITASYTDNSGQSVVKSKVLRGKSGLLLPNSIAKGTKGNTITVEAKCGRSSQSYTVTVLRSPSLAGISVTDEQGTPVEFSSAFRSASDTYAAYVEVGVTKLNMTVETPEKSGYTVTVDGKETTDGTTEIIPAEPGESKVVPVKVTSPEGLSKTYQVTFHSRKHVTLDVRNALAGTILQVKDGAGKTIHREKTSKEGDVTVEKLTAGENYTYTLTKKGYVGKSGTFTASKGENAIDGKLVEAKANTTLKTDLTATWGNFRGNPENNALSTAKIPTLAAETQLYWAVKSGGGWSGAPSSPIIVGDCIVFTTNKEIIKVDKTSGAIVKKGTMKEKSNFNITPPTYGDGMIFVALANGIIQAFDADTLESLWVYQDELKGQPNSPITYHNGYLYTGFWNNAESDGNFVCLTATDEDPGNPLEKKVASWTMANKGGFYWAGAYACDGFVLVGGDDGAINGTDEDSTRDKGEGGKLYALNPETGETFDVKSNLKGDVRSTIAYDKATGKYYFTTSGGGFYTASVDGNKRISLQEISLGGRASSTPVIADGRAYVGVAGKSALGAYSGHRIAVLDLKKQKIVYTVATRGYPQASGVLTSAYKSKDGYNYIYFIENYTPGILRVLKDNATTTKPILNSENNGILGEYEDAEIAIADTLFSPRDFHAEYAICSPIVDEDGTLYFKNDSSYLMAVGSKVTDIEVTKQPDKTIYSVGEVFDPTGMEVTAHFANGNSKDITKYVTYSQEPLTAKDLEVEISYSYAKYNDKEKQMDTPADYIPISTLSEEDRAMVEHVKQLVDTIASSGEENREEAIQVARAAYDDLDGTLKEYVTNHDALVEAENTVASLQVSQDGAPKAKGSAKSYNSISISWSRVSQADGYEVYRSTGKTYTKIKDCGAGITSFVNGGVSTGTKYTYKVRAYKKTAESRGYGSYSKTVSVTTKLAKPGKYGVKAAKKKVNLSWSTVSGASGYEIYYSTKQKSGFKKATTITRSNTKKYTKKSLKSKKTFYFKMRAYRNISGKKVYSDYTATKKVKVK